MINAHFDSANLKQLRELENRLMRTPVNVRRRALKSVSKKILENSKNRIRAQSDLDGQPWARRKSGRRKKMLVGLGRQLKVVTATDDGAIIGWANGLMSFIAGKHQEGHVEAFNKYQFKDNGQIDTKTPATRRQAKALLKAGYKVKRSNGRGYSTPTMKWITENLNIGKAGIILRVLKGRKEFWDIVLPPRSFLGITEAEMTELINLILTETHAELEQELALRQS